MSTTADPSLPHADLLSEIYAVCAATGIAKTRFGLEAVGDASFVTDMENGRECRRKTLERAWTHLRALSSKTVAGAA